MTRTAGWFESVCPTPSPPKPTLAIENGRAACCTRPRLSRGPICQCLESRLQFSRIAPLSRWIWPSTLACRQARPTALFRGLELQTFTSRTSGVGHRAASPFWHAVAWVSASRDVHSTAPVDLKCDDALSECRCKLKMWDVLRSSGWSSCRCFSSHRNSWTAKCCTWCRQ